MTDSAPVPDPTRPQSPASVPPAADAPLVVAAFLARYLADLEAGGARPLADYQALFPGNAERIAAEFARLSAGDTPAEDVVGERLAGYRILGELGRGGQGVVYLAADDRLGRTVALKVLPGAFGAAVARQRLLREAQAASRLDDPGICTVYEAGEAAGIAYLAMRHIDGESLLARIERERQVGVDLGDPARQRALLQTFVRIARSLHAAHEKGLVHRDVKPSNLMLGRDGAPVVLDFGLAHFDDHPDGTMTGGAQLGTPAYMSPEQLAAEQGRVDRRTDVFSLAVTLYEALALQHPFAAPTRERLYQRILGNDPAPLRSLVRALPKDLDAVLACALDKDREHRYATALAFADDLQRVLDRRPIAARSPSLPTQLVRWTQRHPFAAVVTVLCALGLALFATVTSMHNRTLGDALARERLARGEATAAQQREAGLRLAGAAAEVLPHDAELATLLAAEGMLRSDDAATRSALLGALATLRPRQALAAVHGDGWVRVSPNGTRVAVAAHDEVVLFDAATHARLGATPCPDARVAALWWSPDAARFVLAIDNDILRLTGAGFDESRFAVWLCDGGTGARIAELAGHRGRVSAVDFAANAPRVLVGTAPREVLADQPTTAAGALHVWSTTDGQPLWEHAGIVRGIADAAFTGALRKDVAPDVDLVGGDGDYLRLRGLDGSVGSRRTLFDPQSRPAPVASLLINGHVAVLAEGELLNFDGRSDAAPERRPARGARRLTTQGCLAAWTPTVPHAIELGIADARALAVPTQPIVQLGYGMQTVARGALAWSFATTTISVQVLQAMFADGSLRTWRCDTGEFADLPPVGGAIAAAHWSHDGDVLATVGTDGAVRVFERSGPTALPSIDGVDPGSWDAVAPAGDLALAFVDRRPALYDLATGTARWTCERDELGGTIAAFAADAAAVAVGAEDGAVLLFACADGRILRELPATGRDVTGLAFSPDGRHLAIARGDATVVDVASGATVLQLAPKAPAASIWFADDGRRLVTASIAGHRVWSFPDGAPADGRAADAPSAGEGVPAAVAGEVVLLCRDHAVPHHRVGGAAPATLLSSRDGAIRALPAGAEAPCRAGGLSPDGRLAVLPRPDGALLLVDLTGAAPVRTLACHDHAANKVLFAADGSVFASGFAAHDFADHDDERAILVHTRDGEPVLRLEFPAGVRWFALDREGHWLVLKTGDGQIQRLPIRPATALATVGLRELTVAERARYHLDPPR